MKYNSNGTPTNTLRKYSKLQWDGALREARRTLEIVAKKRGQITYSDLAKQITFIPFQPRDWDLGVLIGQLSNESLEAHGFMISSLVVHKYGDQEPGNGFFTFAQQIGLNVTDRLKFWVEHMKKAHHHWST